jgi:hypothetical protein
MKKSKDFARALPAACTVVDHDGAGNDWQA